MTYIHKATGGHLQQDAAERPHIGTFVIARRREQLRKHTNEDF